MYQRIDNFSLMRLTGIIAATLILLLCVRSADISKPGYGQGLFENFEDLFKQTIQNTLTNIKFNNTLVLFNSTNIVSAPLLASSGDNVYVVWTEFNPGDSNILFKASTDGGSTFGETVNLGNKIGLTTEPVLASSESNVYVAWTYESRVNNSIVFKASNNNGSTFDELKYISSIAEYQSPKVSSSKNHVYLSWVDEIGGNSNILFKASTDGGSTFGETVNLGRTTSIVDFPVLASSGDNVYVVWTEFNPGDSNILFKASTDGGSTFGETVNLGNKSRHTGHPLLATSQNNVYVAWQDGTPENMKILFKTSNDNGSTFGQTVDLVVKTGLELPILTAVGNNAYVVWTNLPIGNNDSSALLLKTSNNNGSTFGAQVSITNNILTTSLPIFAASQNNTYVAWANSSGIFFRGSINDSDNFEETRVLYRGEISDNNIILPLVSNIVASDNNIYVAWKEIGSANQTYVNNILITAGKSLNSTNPIARSINEDQPSLYQRCVNNEERVNERQKRLGLPPIESNCSVLLK